MSLADLHRALVDSYAELLEDPRYRAEGLDAAACGPHLKHLAALAAAAAAGGASAAEWRMQLLQRGGPAAGPALDAAEECMRRVGLWPWSS